MSKKNAAVVLKRLAEKYPDPAPALDWRDPWELLVATVLSAQCTDERVNKVTPNIFSRWPGPDELARAGQEEVEEVIRSTGLFRNKAKNLRGAARLIMEEFGGEVPRTMQELTTLPGVARKTANIVLSNAYNVNEGIAVDTHVKRLSNRLGLTDKSDPNRIEKDLMPLFPKKEWGNANHYMVFFGRDTCMARNPQCSECVLEDICPKTGLK